MEKTTGPRPGAIEKLQAELDMDVLNTKREMLQHVRGFLNFDAAFNARVLVLMDLLIEAAKRDPTLLRSGKGGIEETLEALKKSLGAQPGVAGGDVRGADWIDDMRRIIDALTSVVKDEKSFFLQIIKLVMCGC